MPVLFEGSWVCQDVTETVLSSKNKSGDEDKNFSYVKKVHRTGFEPVTVRLEGGCSIQTELSVQIKA